MANQLISRRAASDLLKKKKKSLGGSIVSISSKLLLAIALYVFTIHA